MKSLRRLVTSALLGLGLFFGAALQPAAAQPVEPAVSVVSEDAAAAEIWIFIFDDGSILIVIFE